MKRPKLPKKVHFVDEEGSQIKDKDGWNALAESADKEITLRISVKGVLREFRLRRREVVRILFGEGLENYKRFDESFENEVDEFIHAAIWWAKDEQRAKERRAIVFRRLRIFPEANRIMSPTRFRTSGAQSRIF